MRCFIVECQYEAQTYYILSWGYTAKYAVEYVAMRFQDAGGTVCKVVGDSNGYDSEQQADDAHATLFQSV